MMWGFQKQILQNFIADNLRKIYAFFWVVIWQQSGKLLAKQEKTGCCSNTVAHIYCFGSKQCGHLVFKHLAIRRATTDHAVGSGCRVILTAVRIVYVSLAEKWKVTGSTDAL